MSQHFPEWRLVGLAMSSFLVTLYGWWHLRNGIRVAWGFGWWCAGITLWIYTIHVGLVHMGIP